MENENKTTVEDVEKKANEQAEIDAELAELSDVDVSLPTQGALMVMARERYNYVVSYQSLAVRASALESTVSINNKMQNKKAADQYQETLTAVKNDMNFMLRAIRNIDKDYPEAKAEMLKGVAKETKQK